MSWLDPRPSDPAGLQDCEGHPVLLALQDPAQSKCAGVIYAIAPGSVVVRLDPGPVEPVTGIPGHVIVASADTVMRFAAVCTTMASRSDLIECRLAGHQEGMERRRHRRARVCALVQYWTDTGAASAVAAETVDLAPGGVLFRTGDPPAIGTDVWVRFVAAPLTDLGHLAGRVLRVHRDAGGGALAAVGFWYLPEEAEAQLQQVVEWEHWIAAGRI